MRFDLIFKHADMFIDGVLMTLELTAASLAIGMLIALPVAVLRTMRLPYLDAVLRG